MTDFEKRIARRPNDEPILVDKSICVVPSQVESLKDSNYLDSFVKRTGSERVNFYHPCLSEVADGLKEVSRSTYSWLVLFSSDRAIQKPGSKNPGVEEGRGRKPDIEKTECGFEELDSDVKARLRRSWKKDYIEGVLGDRSEGQKKYFLDLFETGLTEGRHLLFHLAGELVGHGSYVEDLHEILGLPNYYVHYWISQGLDRETKAAIHKSFFLTLSGLDRPAMTGIWVENKKSLSLFRQNGFEPKLLSVGVFECC